MKRYRIGYSLFFFRDKTKWNKVTGLWGLCLGRRQSFLSDLVGKNSLRVLLLTNTQTVWCRLICVLVAHSTICTRVLHPCWTCAFYTYAHTILQAAQELQRYSQIFQIFPLSTDTQTHTSPPLTPLYLCRSTSAECRNTCHKRSKTLTISEFTSAQAQGSARSDHPTAWSSRTKTQRREWKRD